MNNFHSIELRISGKLLNFKQLNAEKNEVNLSEGLGMTFS